MSIIRRMYDYDYRNPGGYFFTINSWHKRNVFSQVVKGDLSLCDQGKIIEACWLQLPKHFNNIDLGIFVIMPNHFHGILIINYSMVGSKHASNLPNSDRNLPIPSPKPDFKEKKKGAKAGSLSAIIQSFKSASTKLIHKNLGTNDHIWQRSFYDHIIRNEFEFQKIHDYIVNNPYNWPSEPVINK